MDLENKSLEELLILQKEIELKIESIREIEKQKLIEEFTLKAESMGFTKEELLSSSAPKKKAVVKYKNPNNDAETWTGRGRKPKWLTEYLETGGTLESTSI